MRTILFSFAFALLIFSACEEPLEKFENQAPISFNVSVISVGDSAATIGWTASQDPDGDSLVYDIFFNGAREFSNYRSPDRRYVFEELNAGTTYSGTVVAKDVFQAETPVGFVFTTEAADTTAIN